jgi:hypothetical protein
LLSLTLAVLLVAQAESPGERLHVEWLAPEGCPSREALAESLEADVPANHTFHASVRIDEPESDGAPWRAVVLTTADGVQHQRVVQATDCQRVSNAAVLVVTLAATSLQVPDEPGFPPAPVEAAPALPQELKDDEKTFEEPFSFAIRVQPVAGANVGLFPLPATSVGLSAALTTGRLRLQATFWSTTALEASSRWAVRGGLTSLAVKGCWLFEPRESVSVGPCLGGEAGRLSAVAPRVFEPHPNTVWWGGGLVGVSAGWAVSKSITPWVSLEAGLNAARPSFIVSTPEGDVFVHQMGWAFGRLTVGVEFELSIP